MYTIDDGTAVVDCALAHSQPPPPSPVKPKTKPDPVKNAAKATGSSFADYLPPPRKSASVPTSSKRASAEPPPPPKPVVRVGQSAMIIGRVVARHNNRMILVDEICEFTITSHVRITLKCMPSTARCASFNDESNHSLSVSELHRTTYYPSEPLPPFVPPALPEKASVVPQFVSQSRPTSPSKHIPIAEPATPVSARSVASSTTTSPCTSAAASSPTSIATAEPQVRAFDTCVTYS